MLAAGHARAYSQQGIAILALILGEHPSKIIIQSTTLTFLGLLFRDYPYTTVPNQVHRIFRAQQLHDKKHYDERVSAKLMFYGLSQNAPGTTESSEPKYFSSRWTSS